MVPDGGFVGTAVLNGWIDSMAKSKTPNPLNRRHLVARDLSQAQAMAYAEAYLAEGRILEAIDFLVMAKAEEKLREVRQQMLEAGDAFGFRVISEAAGIQAKPDEWEILARHAETQGKLLYAAQAQRNAQVSGE